MLVLYNSTSVDTVISWERNIDPAKLRANYSFIGPTFFALFTRLAMLTLCKMLVK